MAKKAMKPTKPSTKRDPSGIQSVEIALRVLQILMRQNAATSLGDLSRATGLQPSKLHRYLVSLVRTGMVEKSQNTGFYSLGSVARQLGIAAFSRFDSFGFAQDRILQIANDTNHDTLLYIWSEHGATLIAQQSGVQPMPMVLRLGSTVPLSRSVVGQVFLAYLPKGHTAPLLLQQQEDVDDVENDEVVLNRLSQIQKDGFYWSTRNIFPGGIVLAVPVFGLRQQLQCVLAIALPRRNMTQPRKEELIEYMLQAAASLSKQMGGLEE